MPTSTQTQLRRGTLSQVNAMTPAQGEVVVNTSDKTLHVGDGTTAGGIPLAKLASPVFTGNPTAPTPSPGDNDTSIATTAFVTNALSSSSTKRDGEFNMATSTTNYANGLSFSRTATGQVTVSHSVGSTNYSVLFQCLSNPTNHVDAFNIVKSGTQFTMEMRDTYYNNLADVTFNVAVIA